MKKIFLSLIAVMATLSINAQRVKVYENGSLSATYTNSSTNTVKVVAEEVPDYVEIGGVKWATKNLGATTVAGSPSTCYGDYYACGETVPRYTSITISSDGTSASFGGWSSSHSSGYSSSDYPTYTGTTLDAAHDAATQNWGSNWRTPTSADFQALAKACTGSTSSNQSVSTLSSSNPTGGIYWLSSSQTYLSEYTGVAGILFVDATDTSKRVFFPGTGYCLNSTYTGDSKPRYWSSSLLSETNAYRLISGSTSSLEPANGFARYYGYTIRPVLNEEAKQVVKVYENGSLSATYGNSSANKVKVVFEEILYVEIGGLRWATKNLGATTIAGDPATCYGDYYAWGETEPRYTSITISSDGTSATFGGWSSSHSSGYSSSDYPSYTGTTLDAAHDAATKNWGSAWRTPTKADFEALQNACTGSTSFCTPTTISANQSITDGGVYWLSATNLTIDGTTYGVKGVLYVDKTDTNKRVFFPAAGLCGDTNFNNVCCGEYWSSSLNTSLTDRAHFLYFYSSWVNPSGFYFRYYGLTVRPVSE